MTAIDRLSKVVKQNGRKLFSPYLTAGFPKRDLTLPLLHTMVEAGADIIELGIPFSDPMAEGVTIQRAMEIALEQNITLDDILSDVAEFRKTNNDTPIILMGYLNSVEAKGYAQFAAKLEQAGVDGTIIVDLPPEEADELLAAWKRHNLHSIFLCSPTTSDDRIQKIGQYNQAYAYYVSLKGVTGSKAISVDDVKQQYTNCKNELNLPLLVGFGIKTPAIATSIANFSDGVVVGAAFLEAIDNADSDKDVIDKAFNFLHPFRLGLDNND